MKILLVQTGFLGDVVLSTPCFSLINKRFPGAAVDILVTPRAADIVQGHPKVREVKIFDKRGKQAGLLGLWRMARVLRKERYDIALSLHKSYRTALLLWLSRIPQRIGFREAAARILYTKVVSRSDLSHEVLRNAAIMRAFGDEPSPEKLDLAVYPSAAAEESARRSIAGLSQPLVGIAPGSVWLTKRWPESHFATLAQQLLKRGASIVILGGPEDAPIATYIMSQQESGERARIRDLTGKTSLIESAAVIALCDVVVTNDSAPLHLAAAARRPTVALFCATIPEFGFGPWRNPHVNLGVDDLECRPCGRHGGNSCPTGTNACRFDLLPDRVLHAVLSQLNSPIEAAKV